MPSRIRDMIRHQAPSWLVAEEGYKLQYSCARVLDILLENAYYAMVHRFPGYVDGGTAQRIGEFSGITRSPFHTDAEYLARLKQRHVLNSEKGSAERFIREIAGFFGAAGQWNAVMVIYGNGERLSMQPNDPLIYKDQTNFTSEGWAICHVVIVRTAPFNGEQQSALRQTLREFKAGHILGRCGLLGFMPAREYYSEVPQLPAPMSPLTVRGIAGAYSEAGESYSSNVSPVIFSF